MVYAAYTFCVSDGKQYHHVEVIRGNVTKGWRADRRRDHYYRKAKREDYRSRAAYKLKQLDYKFDIMRPGDSVVDLGASPGGWSQVAAEMVGNDGKVFSLDLDRFSPIDGVTFMRGDIRKDSTVERLLEQLPDGADVVLSDMSPNISGNYSYDHARSVDLCEHALAFALKVLKEGGHFVVKMFYGDMSKGYISTVRRAFEEVHVTHPKASRSTSSEVYVVALVRRYRR